jgi:hypothetical protein
VARVARAVIVYVFRSNKGYPPIIKIYLLAPLSALSLTLILNTYKLTSKRYLLRGPLALRFRSLPLSIVLNHRIIRLVVIFIIRRIVIAIALPITRAIF